MKPWEDLGSTPVPGGGTMTLHRRDRDYVLKVNGIELMTSRMHGSEEVLAEMACEGRAERGKARVLVGGLGMGFTAAAALRCVGEDSEVVIAELVPGVVEWNRGDLGAVSGRPLEDPRTTLVNEDVADILRRERDGFDVVLLDVDNSSTGLTLERNDWLYGPAALRAIAKALRPGGILGVWSLEQDPAFCSRMRNQGYSVTERWVRARRTKGPRHWIWLAEPPGGGAKKAAKRPKGRRS